MSGTVQENDQSVNYGTMHNGCWYPPNSTEVPQQGNNMKPQQLPVGGNMPPMNSNNMPNGMQQQGFFVQFPPQGNRVIPVVPVPGPNGQQIPPMQMLLLMQQMQSMQNGGAMLPMMNGGMDPNVNMQGMMPNPNMAAKPMMPGMPPVQPGMEGLPPQQQVPQMQQMPANMIPVPNNLMGMGQKLNYVPGTFTEDQIVHQTVTDFKDGWAETTEVKGQPGGIDILPEILRKLSMSPSQSEMSSQSTNVYASEECSHASSDTDNANASGPETPGTGSSENQVFPSEEASEDQTQVAAAPAPKKAWATVAEVKDEPARGYDRRRGGQGEQARGEQPTSENRQYGRGGQGRRPYTSNNNMSINSNSNNSNYPNNMRNNRGASNRNGKQYPQQQQGRGSPRNQQQGAGDDNEWQTVDRSRTKNRNGGRGYNSRV